MDKKILSKILLLSTLVLLAGFAFAGTPAFFEVTEPDGTDDETSGYYTLMWTPEVETTHSMIDGNTISCYADADASDFDQTYTIATGMATDLNQYRFDTFGWTGRQVGTDYYIWCINDVNGDVNDYSAGPLTLSQYGARDVGPIAIDTAGKILDAFAKNIGVVAGFLVVIIIVVFLVDMITGVFGIITAIRGFMSKR